MVRHIVSKQENLLKSPILVGRWPEQVFVSGDSSHLISRFCGVVLGPTTNYKMVSEPPPISIGPPAIRFLLLGHPPFISHTPSPIMLGVRVVLKSPSHITKRNNKLEVKCYHIVNYCKRGTPNIVIYK